MPPKVKVTKKMVADASFEIIRASGHESLNARTIAEYLGCSTQPVLYSYRTMDEIREAAYETADQYHTAFIMPKETESDPMLALGLNYVRFGYEEKNLFRFLFQTDKFGGMDVEALLNDPNLSAIVEVMAKGLACEPREAREMFLTFFCHRESLGRVFSFLIVSSPVQGPTGKADIQSSLFVLRFAKKRMPFAKRAFLL